MKQEFQLEQVKIAKLHLLKIKVQRNFPPYNKFATLPKATPLVDDDHSLTSIRTGLVDMILQPGRFTVL